MNNCAKYHHHTQKCNFLGGKGENRILYIFRGPKKWFIKKKKWTEFAPFQMQSQT